MVEIPLRRRDGTIRAFALIDDEDAAQAVHCWRLLSNGYVGRNLHGVPQRGSYVVLCLHREILGLARGDGIEGDHRDGNRLDCRRSNLRTATGAQNRQNVTSRPGSSSRFRGVYWDRSKQKWAAKVKLDGRAVWLGRFDSEVEAGAVAEAFRLAHMPFAVAGR